jgi:hypothetical protein
VIQRAIKPGLVVERRSVDGIRQGDAHRRRQEQHQRERSRRRPRPRPGPRPRPDAHARRLVDLGLSPESVMAIVSEVIE